MKFQTNGVFVLEHNDKSEKLNFRKITGKLCEKESLCQQMTNIKSHMASQKSLKCLTFGDPDGSSSFTKILKLEYIENSSR